MKYSIILLLLLITGRPTLGAVTCQPQLGTQHVGRDLTLEALLSIASVREFNPAIWEGSLNGNSNVPFIIVVGPDSDRKANAIKALKAKVPDAKDYDLYTGTAEGFALGMKEFQVSAWISVVPLHILSVSIPKDYLKARWLTIASAREELVRLGFQDKEVMSTAGVYLIDP